ncbi:MAG: Holliday junction branch migration protein RuvA [bacterium]
MLAFLSATILTHTKDGAIVRVGDLGYEVIGTWLGREPVGTKLDIFTYQYYENESIPRLIGTPTKIAREFLMELMTVQGVGPKMASRILDSADITRLKKAITEGDINTLRGVKGLGLKTAQKIILELGKKLVSEETSGNTTVYQALQELGFSKIEIDQAITKSNLDGLSENECISAVLKNLGRSR